MHTEGVHMGTNRAPIKTHAKVTLWVITLWVNFGLNYRDLGHFVRVTFMAKISGTLSGIRTTFRGPFIFFVVAGRTMCSHRILSGPLQRAPIDPGGIEPQPIKLEFTIYPAELWI